MCFLSKMGRWGNVRKFKTKIEIFVWIEVLKLDRGSLDPKNILAREAKVRNGDYRRGSSHAILNRRFSSGELIMNQASEPLNINCNECLTLWEATNKFSQFGGQGFTRCTCKPSNNQCRTNWYFCFKNYVKCGSKCHTGGPCENK